MVKKYLIRHAQSEFNLLKLETAKHFDLKYEEQRFFLGFKFMNREHLVDAPISKLGEMQCKLANLENKDKFKKVRN